MDTDKLNSLANSVAIIIIPLAGAEEISEAELQEQVRQVLEASPLWPDLRQFYDVFRPLNRNIWGATAFRQAYPVFLERLGVKDSPALEYLCTSMVWIETNYDDLDEVMQKRLQIALDDDAGQPVRVLRPSWVAGIPTR